MQVLMKAQRFNTVTRNYEGRYLPLDAQQRAAIESGRNIDSACSHLDAETLQFLKSGGVSLDFLSYNEQREQQAVSDTFLASGRASQAKPDVTNTLKDLNFPTDLPF